ncbi:DUF4041 domain-containing protein [Mucilaginibacter sp. Bleaf8]|uniref:DUF4041 domain-containing protein n=1 Tax=Mucilaginibacter sp. Bleaf8 TaxID=2834430 RepID=UPI001BCB14EF|nr:DUF4041 domain-containing protein [Mucilaginibacter sp. Bleaf8]MBS7565773.1 DUF4041 domain-containing protein [Mucilaginibacter sp. Bleaf8]
MTLIYILAAALIGLSVALLILLKNSRATKANLETQVTSSFQESVRLNEINSLQSAELDKFRTKYERIISIEQAVEDRKIELRQLKGELVTLNDKFQSGKQHYEQIKRELAIYEDDLEVISFGLYKPRHGYATSEEFKQKLEANYQHQRELIKTDKATTFPNDWTVNGSLTEGKKMTKLNIKNMLYAFNGECDALIAKVKWNNATKSIERLEKAFESINKLGTVNRIQITRPYYNLKKHELTLTYEYENKKQEEKEEQRRIREQMREEEKVLKDIEKAKKEAEDEEKKYQKALLKAQEELSHAGKDDFAGLNSKIAELEAKLKEAEEKRQRALSLAQQTKAGHIYVISNIGSFGEDVYKIGMTRRLDPLDRVKELGDASVPFAFDVHAIIYSENAPALEHELHKRFHDHRLNRVNGRREFFKVSLDQIEAIVKEHTDAEIEFTLLAEAQEYRESLNMIQAMLKAADIQVAKVDEKYPENLL